ncbi:hypothetical protein EUGRSUZ_F04063 [Eucalyptus grandis]|uniref:Uncharacterized protein n=2 Tax=Eucalyptus grandis TaxID=71139 RepID=A0A059BXM5_EUCGR|nr:hypothetical protein EUGRSUZ_F04063 [Eucalyptus grandis]
MTPLDIRFPVFEFVGCMLLLPTILLICASTEDVAIMVELPLCDNPGVGIIVGIELGFTGFRLLRDGRLIKLCNRNSNVLIFKYSSYIVVILS